MRAICPTVTETMEPTLSNIGLLSHRAQRSDGEVGAIESFEEESPGAAFVFRLVVGKEIDGIVPQVERSNGRAELSQRRRCTVVAFEQWSVPDDRYE